MIKWNNNDYRSFVEPLDIEDGEQYVIGFDRGNDDDSACVIYGRKCAGRIIIDEVRFK